MHRACKIAPLMSLTLPNPPFPFLESDGEWLRNLSEITSGALRSHNGYKMEKQKSKKNPHCFKGPFYLHNPEIVLKEAQIT